MGACYKVQNPMDLNNINIKVSSPGKSPRQSPGKQTQSPRFGGVPKKREVNEAMEKVGKHGKSHHLYMKVMGAHKPVEEMRRIGLEELAQHKGAESAWLALGGIVYDVTTYLHYHPGGDILLKGCGKDCQALFYQYHPWVNAKHLLEKYAIGYLSF